MHRIPRTRLRPIFCHISPGKHTTGKSTEREKPNPIRPSCEQTDRSRLSLQGIAQSKHPFPVTPQQGAAGATGLRIQQENARPAADKNPTARNCRYAFRPLSHLCWKMSSVGSRERRCQLLFSFFACERKREARALSHVLCKTLRACVFDKNRLPAKMRIRRGPALQGSAAAPALSEEHYRIPPPHRHSGHQNSNPSKRLNTTSLRVRKSHGSQISSKTSVDRFASGSASKRSR